MIHEIELDNLQSCVNDLNPRWDLEIELSESPMAEGFYQFDFYYPNKKYEIKRAVSMFSEKDLRKLFTEPEKSIWDLLIPVKDRPVTVKQKVDELVMNVYRQIIEKVRYQTQ